jgi:drug/metabolite transporter (DMT)-like permease
LEVTLFILFVYKRKKEVKGMSEEKAAKEQKIFLGTILTLLSGLLFALYSVTAKWAQQEGANFYQVTFFTFFVCWISVIPHLLIKPIHHLKTNKFTWHFLRAFFGVLIVYFFVISLQTIPLVDAMMLNNSAPIFIPIIAYFVLKIPINHRLWFAIALGIIGIILILRPDKQMFNIGGVWALMSALAMSLSWICIRKLTYTEPISRIIFYFFTLAMILSAIPLIWTWQPLPKNSVWVFLVLSGGCYLGCSWFFALAAKRISVTMISMLFYSSVVFTVFLDGFFFHQFLGVLTALGVILVTGSGILSLWLEGKKLK